MRKRFIAFMLAVVIISLDLGNVFANSITVLDPVMADKPNIETVEDNDSSPVKILDSRDKDNKILENSPSILQNPLELGARDNGKEKKSKATTEDKNDKKSTNSVVELETRKEPEKTQNKEIKKNSKSLQKNILNTSPFSLEKRESSEEGLGEEIEVSEPIKGGAVTGTGATRPAGGWETYEIGNGWTLGDFTYNGDIVTGFSDSGKAKVETNKDLVVPSVIPDNSIDEFDKLKPVTTIGNHAFKYNQLTSVVIPEGVTTIGSYAFSSNKLTSVVISEGVTTIREGAFYDNKLTSLVIPEGVTTIGDYAFKKHYNNPRF